MTTKALLEQAKYQKIGKAPVVVLPLVMWRQIEDLVEDYEMLNSRRFRKSIEEARKEFRRGNFYEFNAKTGTLKRPPRRHA